MKSPPPFPAKLAGLSKSRRGPPKVAILLLRLGILGAAQINAAIQSPRSIPQNSRLLLRTCRRETRSIKIWGIRAEVMTPAKL